MPVEIRTRTAPPPQGAPGEIDTLFVVSSDTALTAGKASLVRSISDYESLGATRAIDPLTYDGLDVFFREGGRMAYVAKKGVDLASTLPVFTEDLGGGQVVSWTASPVVGDYTALLDHATTSKRFALLDVASTDNTVALLTTAAGKNPTLNADRGAMFGPWVNTPPPGGVLGATSRTVPASAVVAALIARSDSLGNPNRAPAGRDFPLQYATSVNNSVPLTDVNTATLRDAGLNPLRSKFGLMVLDGFQTKILSDPDDPFWQANVSRARMWLQWQALNVGLNYEYKPIDGRGRLTAGLEGDLNAVCKSLWEVNGLFGGTARDAYAVNVGVSINTTTTVAYGELHAVVEARFSLHARTVIIELVAVPITGSVSG